MATSASTYSTLAARLPIVQAPGDASHHEHDQADPVQPGSPVHVGQPAAQQQEPPEGDRITADQPLQRRRGDVQAVLNRGQRDVDDREVQHDHELRHRQSDQQREPSPGCARRGFVQAVTQPASAAADRFGIPPTR